MFKEIKIVTDKGTDVIEITSQVANAISESTIKNGICIVFSPHTTAGITINEHADPAVKEDIKNELNIVIPFDDNYQHSEGNSAAHIKTSIIGPSQTLILEKGKLMLGTWQGIFLCEFDGPRDRKVWIKIIGT